jgi:hypothetical protein
VDGYNDCPLHPPDGHPDATERRPIPGGEDVAAIINTLLKFPNGGVAPVDEPTTDVLNPKFLFASTESDPPPLPGGELGPTIASAELYIKTKHTTKSVVNNKTPPTRKIFLN